MYLYDLVLQQNVIPVLIVSIADKCEQLICHFKLYIISVLIDSIILYE